MYALPPPPPPLYVCTATSLDFVCFLYAIVNMYVLIKLRLMLPGFAIKLLQQVVKFRILEMRSQLLSLFCYFLPEWNYSRLLKPIPKAKTLPYWLF